MKCQRCNKQAAYHVTEVHAPEQVEELHLCEECAKKHLYQPPPPPPSAKKTSAKAESGADDFGKGE